MTGSTSSSRTASARSEEEPVGVELPDAVALEVEVELADDVAEERGGG
jgi:hypothetical protein